MARFWLSFCLIGFLLIPLACGGARGIRARQPVEKPGGAESDEAPSLELHQFLYPTTKNGRKGVSRPDLIGQKIRTGVAVSIFHDQTPGKDNPHRLKVICGSGDEKAIYMLLVEFLDSQKEVIQAVKGHDIILVRGVLNQRGDVAVLEQAELLKAVHP